MLISHFNRFVVLVFSTFLEESRYMKLIIFSTVRRMKSVAIRPSREILLWWNRYRGPVGRYYPSTSKRFRCYGCGRRLVSRIHVYRRPRTLALVSMVTSTPTCTRCVYDPESRGGYFRVRTRRAPIIPPGHRKGSLSRENYGGSEPRHFNVVPLQRNENGSAWKRRDRSTSVNFRPLNLPFHRSAR